jgi:hypothetical protein
MIDQLGPILDLIKAIFTFLGAFIYFIFAAVIVKQVKSMSKIVQDKFNTILIIFSYLHLLFALLLLVISLLLLLT